MLLGPQGSGKGTQADYLARRLRIPTLSVGEILRLEVASRTPFGRRYARLLATGRLAPDRLVNVMVAKRLRRGDARRGFILDGYPRSLPQLRFLETEFPGTVAILLHIPDAVAVRRINRRRISPTCGRIYHLDYLRPKHSGVCDTCGDRLIQRVDDKPVAVRRRLSIYHRQTEPVLRHYRAAGRLITVDGRPRIAVVRRAVIRAVARFAG